MAEIPHLPEELLIEIFSRLPTKSVGRCRCLSRLWRSRLSNSQFINLHLNRKPHQESLLLITVDEYKCSYGNRYRTFGVDADRFINTVTFPITEEPVLKKIDVPNKWVELVGSVNGLVLMVDRLDQMLLLMNPVTREYVTISIPNKQECTMYGFGYDSSSNDYKIVMLADGTSYCGVSVYSLKTGFWVRKDNLPYHFRSTGSGALLDGALHWFTDANSQFGGSPLIVAFDLASEEFCLVPAPTHTFTDEFYSCCGVYVLGGCLCIVELDDYIFQVWLMNDYGIQKSWTHLASYPNRVKPLCYGGGDELLLLDSNMMELIVFYVKEKTKMEVWLGDRDVVTDGCVFVESLVSPKHHAILSEREES